MRILWFTDWQPPAVRRRLGLPDFPGPQAWVDALAACLRSQPGIELAIATPGQRPFAPFEEDGVLYLDVRGRRPARTRVGRILDCWRHRLTSPETLSAAASLVRELQPDVVHVHGTEGGFGLLAPHLAPTPFVVSLQGILQAYERRYFSGRSREDILRLVASAEFIKGRGLVHRYILLRRQAAREAVIMRGARHFIGRTRWDREIVRRMNPGAQYFHCDEMIRPEFHDAAWAPPQGGGMTVYSTSSAMLGKGTECLLAAFALLRERGRRDVGLRIAGVEPGSEVDLVYRRAARRLGLEGQVQWLGRLDAAGIAGELQAAHVFAYPSHIDNSPNAVVEAMLVGAPIVATRVGGIPTLVRDGEEGLLVQRGDAAALAAAIERVLDDPGLAARLGAAAAATAHRRNDPAAIVERTTAIYAAVAGRSATASGDHESAAESTPDERGVHTRPVSADILEGKQTGETTTTASCRHSERMG
jgi:glycosyltransferase involved in cell wall biosynthesis